VVHVCHHARLLVALARCGVRAPTATLRGSPRCERDRQGGLGGPLQCWGHAARRPASQVVSPALLAAADSATSTLANVCSRLIAVCPNRARKSVHAVTFLPEQPWMMSACEEGKFTAWTTNDFTRVREFDGHDSSGVQFMRWNRAGSVFASGDVRGVIRWWDTSITKVAEVRSAHKDDRVRAAE
jgi:WD40 repeat protein